MMNPDQFYDTIRRNIEGHKRHLQGVIGCEPGQPDFIYSIGNQEAGLPELLLIGTAGVEGALLLNNLCDQMLENGIPFDSGDLVYWKPREPHMKACKIIAASPSVKEDYTVQAGQYYENENYTVMQVLIPDTNGKFPGEEGADPKFADIPVLGVQ